MHRFWLCFLLGLAHILYAQSQANSPIHIIVSVLPQKELVQRIGGDSLLVSVLVPNGKSPELYEPNLAQMKIIQDSKLFFGVGMPFEEKWLSRFKTTNPHLTYYNLALDSEMMARKDSMLHTHNPHIWLSLEKSKKHIELITHALQEIAPENASLYEHNKSQLLTQIATLQKQIHRIFSQVNASKTFLVYHPAFEYFTQEFNLHELSLEHNGKEPKGQDLARLITEIKKHRLSTLFTQPQFSESRIQAISKELHLKVIKLDPLHEEWLHSFKIYACAIAFSLPPDEIQPCVKQYFGVQ